MWLVLFGVALGIVAVGYILISVILCDIDEVIDSHLPWHRKTILFILYPTIFGLGYVLFGVEWVGKWVGGMILQLRDRWFPPSQLEDCVSINRVDTRPKTAAEPSGSSKPISSPNPAQNQNEPGN